MLWAAIIGNEVVKLFRVANREKMTIKLYINLGGPNWRKSTKFSKT